MQAGCWDGLQRQHLLEVIPLKSPLSCYTRLDKCDQWSDFGFQCEDIKDWGASIMATACMLDLSVRKKLPFIFWASSYGKKLEPLVNGHVNELEHRFQPHSSLQMIIVPCNSWQEIAWEAPDWTQTIKRVSSLTYGEHEIINMTWLVLFYALRKCVGATQLRV